MQHIVGPFGRGHQETRLVTYRPNLSIGNLPLRLSRWLPAVQGFAIEQRDPTVVEQLLGQKGRLRRPGRPGKKKTNADRAYKCSHSFTYKDKNSPRRHKGHEEEKCIRRTTPADAD